MTAHLLIGPVLRRVVGDRATIWVETTEPALVRVEAEGGGAGSAPTFSAYGHHYAIVVVEGLVPGADNPYQVLLDERVVWPAAGVAVPARRVISTRPADDARPAGQPDLRVLPGGDPARHRPARCRRTRWTPTPAG